MKSPTQRPPTEAPTLVHLLRARAEAHPDRPAFTFLDRSGAVVESVRFGELDERARSIASALQARHAAGERVLLLFPPGLTYVTAFFACLYAGATAVPAYPPRASRRGERLRDLAVDARAAFVLAADEVVERSRPRSADGFAFAEADWLPASETSADPDDWIFPTIDGKHLAFLQYTSGSTGTPKGVMLTHENLLANSEFIRRSFGHDERSQGVIWLPPYHDMGLIGGIIQPLYAGFHTTLMAPLTFLQNPYLWLQAISGGARTTSGGPNFAYDLCVRRVTEAQRATLDLSCWDVAFNGAEPISADTLDRFAATFEPCGFRRRAFHPCYGLAEATLMVSAMELVEEPIPTAFSEKALAEGRAEAASGGRPLVASGIVPVEHDVAIVAADGTRALPNRVGEIWIRGPGVAVGYWHREDVTLETFGARLDGGRPYLRTGDLGFLHDNRLFVTGRLKDLIIVRGRNHYPHDIERTVEQSHPALRPGGGAVFAVTRNGDERLVIVHEFEVRARHADSDKVISAVREAVTRSHGLAPLAVVLLRPGTLPTTSSGKPRRGRCRELFMDGSLNQIAEWREVENDASNPPPFQPAPLDPEAPEAEARIAAWARRWLAARLGQPESAVTQDTPLARLGVDSLVAVELVHALDSAFGVSLGIEEALGDRSVAELAAALNRALRARGGAQPAVPPAIVSGDDQPWPASSGQKSLWLAQQSYPDSPAYNISVAALVHGDLNEMALRRTTRRLLERHPQLRTVFREVNSEIVQQVLAEPDDPFAVEDVTAHNDAGIERRLRELADMPFDLGRGPPLRLRLLMTANGRPRLLLVVHHIVADLWSLDVIWRDLARLYEIETGSAEVPEPAPPPDYRAIAFEREKVMLGEEGERLWQYWRSRLRALPASVELPVARVSAEAAFRPGGSVAFEVPAALAARMRTLASATGTSPFAVMLAAFQTTLYRYSGQEDVPVGSPFSNRPPRARDVVGYFANPVVLRGDLSGRPSFRVLLDRSAAVVREATAHQAYPFGRVVERLRKEGDVSAPLFRVMLSWNASRGDTGRAAARQLGVDDGSLVLGRARLEPLRLEPSAVQYDLRLVVVEAGECMRASLEYAAAMFDRDFTEGMTRHLLRILDAATEDPDRRIDQLPLLDDEELARVMQFSCGAASGAPSGPGLHELFEEQARRTPDVPAAIFESSMLSYAELNSLSDRMATVLRTVGVRADAHVGVLMERSLELPAVLLAILKAGAAYVPLDPEYPAERLNVIVEDAGLRLIVAQAHLAEGPQAPHFVAVRAPIVTVEQLAGGGEGTPTLRDKDASERAAYIIFTSGSTGRPKGVVMTHDAIRRRLLWTQRIYPLHSRDRVLQKTPTSFDVSVWEFFWPMLAGAAIVLARPGGHRDPAYLADLIAAESVTIAHFVPSMLRAFLDEPRIQHCRSLRRVICSGEFLPAELQNHFHSLLAASLHNLYGPTEAAIDVTAWDCRRDDDSAIVPIGRPADDTQIYVLDDRMQPVPVGVPGELWIGGAFLARGYHGRPELTADRFVPDPFGTVPGGRLYRSGDRARWHRDGALQYLGRVDRQVKLRGFRIELEEIEAKLREFVGVFDAAVVVQEVAEHEQLVAFVVPVGPAQSTASMRDYLGARLPTYMLPTQYRLVEALPLMPSGKLDRRRLTDDRAAVETGDTAPLANKRERLLAQVWREVLELERVDVNASFFELGGDSILALKAVAGARRYGLSLTLAQVFEHKTIAQLAAVAVDESVQLTERPTAAALLPVQRWFFELNLKHRGRWSQGAILECDTDVDIDALRRALSGLTERHDALRLHFARAAEGLQTADTQTVLLCLVEPLPGEDVPMERIVEELQAALNPAEGRVFHAALMRGTAPETSKLVLVAHHLAVDALSWPIILADLNEAYRRECAQMPPATPPLAYLSWAAALQRRATDPTLLQEVPFWTAALVPGDLTIPAAPVDASANAVEALVTATIDATTIRTLFGEARRALRARPDEVLLAALARSIALVGGAVRIDVEGHGRDAVPELDASCTVGWFTVLYPVRVQFAASASPLDDLATTKDLLRSVPGGGEGYGLLRYGDTVEAAAVREATPADVLFNYLGTVDVPRSLDGPFQPSSDPILFDRGPNRPPYPLEMIAMIREGHLEVVWVYDATRVDGGVVAAIAERFTQKLDALAAALREVDGFRLTPADVPLARLDAATLAAVVARCPGPVEDVYPLTPLQRGMLFHSLSAPEERAYEVQVRAVLTGPLDPDALQSAWRRLVARHPSLRVACIWHDLEEPVQCVLAPSAIESRLEAASDADAVAERHRSQRVGPDAGALMRTALVRRGDGEHELVWTYHHMLFDGWSLAVLLEELLELYGAEAGGPGPAPSPFREHLAWLERRDHAAAERFWRAELAGLPPAAHISPRSRRAGGLGASPQREPFVRAALPGDAVKGLRRLARAHGLTVSTVMQAAWALLLARITGETDVVFGVTVNGRPEDLPGTERMVGLFINTVPLRVRVEADEPLVDLCARIQNAMVRLSPHAHVSSARLQRWLGTPGTALFESAVVFENYPVSASLRDISRPLRFRSVESTVQTSLPLTLLVFPEEGLALQLKFDPERLAALEVEALISVLVTLLERIASGEARTAALRAEVPEQPPVDAREKAPAVNAQVRPVAPLDEVERRVTAVWCEVLERPSVGRDENFFDLGGHSVALIRVQTRLKETLGIEVPIVDLFDHSTVVGLARHLVGATEPTQVFDGHQRAELRRRMASDRRKRRTDS